MDENTNVDPIMGGDAQDGTQTNPSVEPNFSENQSDVKGDGVTVFDKPHVQPRGAKPNIASISERLSEQESGEARGSEVMNTETPIPFDLSQLRPEQLQQLKQMLAATPDRIVRKKKNPTVTLRVINDKVIVNHKNTYKALVDDPENNRKVERHHIPVLFQGDKDYTVIMYKEFINSPRVACEVTGTRSETDEIVEGETVSRETGQMVEMVVKVIRDYFTIKLPDGSTIEIEGKIANA